MDILKTPQQKLLEEAGAVPASPGMVHTPQQMLMQESGIMPRFADGGSVQMSPQDMLAELIYGGHLPEYFAKGGSVTSAEFEAALESARRQPGLLKRGASKATGLAGRAFNKMNPLFQVMAAEDAGNRAMDAGERSYHGEYRCGAFSGLGALGSGVGMAPGFVPQLVSIPLSLGADYLQEYFDEKDPHKSRASLKIQN